MTMISTEVKPPESPAPQAESTNFLADTFAQFGLNVDLYSGKSDPHKTSDEAKAN